jgi:hypothetical protein
MPLLKPRQQVVVQVVHDRSPSAFPESTSHRCIEAVRASTPTGKPRQAWSRGNFRQPILFSPRPGEWSVSPRTAPACRPPLF